MQSDTPNQIIGVLAHETGHLAGGHLSKLREQLAQAQTQLIIAMLLRAGAMVAGARSGDTKRPAHAGAAGSPPPLGNVRRPPISYVRPRQANTAPGGGTCLT